MGEVWCTVVDKAYIYRYSYTGTTLTDLIDGDGTHCFNYARIVAIRSKDAGIPATAWAMLMRGACIIDTSTVHIPANANITLARMYYGTPYPGINELNISPSFNIYDLTPNSSEVLAKEDYQNCGSTPLSTEVAYADLPGFGDPDGYFELNPAGLAHINLGAGARTAFCYRFSDIDVGETAPAVTQSDALTQIGFGSSLYVKYTLGTETPTPTPTASETPTPTPTATPEPSGAWCGHSWDDLSKIRGNTISAGDLECGVDLS